MLKFEDNPPALSLGSAPECERDVPGTWWVGHTKARFEKAFVVDLAGRDIHDFLPYVERVRFSGGRNRRVLIPLFQSYVFFCGGEAERHAAPTMRLCQVIPVRDQGKFVSEIAALEQAVRNGVQLHPFMGIAVGRRCRVTSGPMENVCGVVVRLAEKAHVVMEVRMLGQGLAARAEPGIPRATGRGRRTRSGAGPGIACPLK